MSYFKTYTMPPCPGPIQYFQKLVTNKTDNFQKEIAEVTLSSSNF